MKKRLKITGGKFEATPDNSLIYRRKIKDLYEYGGGVAGDKPVVFVNKGFYGKDDKGYNVKANAELIADAFNTANETQLLPSELKEQRNEVIKRLQSLVLSMASHPDCTKGSEFDDLSTIGQELINKIKNK